MKVISQATTLLAMTGAAFFHLSAAAPVLMDDAVLELAVQSVQPEASTTTTILSMAAPQDSVEPALNGTVGGMSNRLANSHHTSEAVPRAALLRDRRQYLPIGADVFISGDQTLVYVRRDTADDEDLTRPRADQQVDEADRQLDAYDWGTGVRRRDANRVEGEVDTTE